VRLAIDFDGTLVQERGQGPFPRPLEWRPGAIEGLRRLAAHHFLILHTARLTPPEEEVPDGTVTAEARQIWEARRHQLEQELRARVLWLRAEGGVFDMLWDRIGKPEAFLYIDDRSLAGAPDWRRVLALYG
jgi:hypothetical protein